MRPTPRVELRKSINGLVVALVELDIKVTVDAVSLPQLHAQLSENPILESQWLLSVAQASGGRLKTKPDASDKLNISHVLKRFNS